MNNTSAPRGHSLEARGLHLFRINSIDTGGGGDPSGSGRLIPMTDGGGDDGARGFSVEGCTNNSVAWQGLSSSHFWRRGINHGLASSGCLALAEQQGQVRWHEGNLRKSCRRCKCQFLCHLNHFDDSTWRVWHRAKA